MTTSHFKTSALSLVGQFMIDFETGEPLRKEHASFQKMRDEKSLVNFNELWNFLAVHFSQEELEVQGDYILSGCTIRDFGFRNGSPVVVYASDDAISIGVFGGGV